MYLNKVASSASCLPDYIADLAKNLLIEGDLEVQDKVYAENGLYVSGTKVIGAQQAHIADTTTQDIAGSDTVDETKLESDLSGIVSTINSILSALETHGLVAST